MHNTLGILHHTVKIMHNFFHVRNCQLLQCEVAMIFKHEEDDDEMTQKTKEWLAQFTDWAIKLMIVGIFGFMYGMSKKQDEMITQMALERQSNEARVLAVEKDIALIKANMVTWDVLKRVEQALQIVLLQSGIKQRVDLTSGRSTNDQ
jgi:hypothetical protein